jgi:murein DD-endopeptidase MepM/ murein hydrolase activator NlpD
MDSPFLHYPVEQPINPNNLFGATSPMYTGLGQKGHPGNDFECPMYTPIYAPCDGGAFYASDKNGGDGLWIRYPSNAKPEFSIILYHMPPSGTTVTLPDGNTDSAFKVSTTPGVVTPVKAGQLLGYSGDSGYPIESSGPHLHLGVMPCDFTGEALYPNNGYLGCVDPAPFYTGLYARVEQTETQVVQTAQSVVEQIAVSPTIPAAQKNSLLDQVKALLTALSAFFKGRNNP